MSNLVLYMKIVKLNVNESDETIYVKNYYIGGLSNFCRNVIKIMNNDRNLCKNLIKIAKK